MEIRDKLDSQDIAYFENSGGLSKETK